MFPTASEDIAKEVAELVGERSKLVDRAKTLGEKGNPQLAMNRLDFAIDSGDELKNDALNLKADMLQKIADAEKSFIARNIFLGGIRQVKKTQGN